MNFNDALKLTPLPDPSAPSEQAKKNQAARKESGFHKWKREHGVMTDWNARARMWCAITKDKKRFHSEDIKQACEAAAKYLGVQPHAFQE